MKIQMDALFPPCFPHFTKQFLSQERIDIGIFHGAVWYQGAFPYKFYIFPAVIFKISVIKLHVWSSKINTHMTFIFISYKDPFNGNKETNTVPNLIEFDFKRLKSVKT